MSNLRPQPHNRRGPTPSESSKTIRWRLWAAMLALALVPTISGIYLTMSLVGNPASEAMAEHLRETSGSAAGLLAREQAITGRLLAAATDPQLARVADGIDGSGDRQLAQRTLNGLRGDDGAVVASACIVRHSDGKRIPLTGGMPGACADEQLRRRAIGTDAVARTIIGDDEAQRLIIATPLRSLAGRDSAVLSAELDVATLFDRTHMLGGDSVSSMLVDMGSSEVVATSAATVGPVDGVEPVDPAAILPYLPGVVANSNEAADELRAMGLAPTVVPLWDSGDGARLGLVQLWPETSGVAPFELRLAMLITLAGVILTVIVLVRYFLRPFVEAADSHSELQELYHEAVEDALVDGLTGLSNHRAFQEELKRQVEAFEPRALPFSLVLMDLDDLKMTNDRDGHAAGDELLVSMARRMRDSARREDMLFRTGGDEFAMILPGTDPEEAVGVAQRVLYFCKRPPSGGRPSPFSAGISGVPRFARKRETVFRQADAALYWAKRNFRGTVELFDPERDLLETESSDATADAVAEVIANKLLRPVFQPIVDLRTGRILGFEGLIRPDPNGPLPNAEQLFAAAAHAGRTVDLDLACIEAVVNAAGAIGSDRLLTLNLSPRTLEVNDFDAAWLLSGLMRNGISPGRVIIELTERDEIDDPGRLQQKFNLLQQYGLRIAADDVGAGNSGLRLLSQVQFDIVKIDLALVQSGVRRVGARAVLESLRDLALSQNARIIAEGVETSRQLQAIRELDLGAAQGFLLGRPDASVEKTFVDLRELESGVVVPDETQPAFIPEPAGPVIEGEIKEIGEQRRAIFLPPAKPVLEADPGTA